jgi:hypothetical protein
MDKKRDPRVKQFVDYAFTTYRKKYHTRLVITGADTANTKRVLATVELERLKQYWDWFLHYNGQDFVLQNATRDIKTFCGYINRIEQKCRIKPQITITEPDENDIVWAEVAASTRAEELFNTMDPLERKKRLTEIERRLIDTHPGWDTKVYHDSCIAILKAELENDARV